MLIYRRVPGLIRTDFFVRYNPFLDPCIPIDFWIPIRWNNPKERVFWSINSHDYTSVSNWFQCPRIGLWGNLQETTTFLGEKHISFNRRLSINLGDRLQVIQWTNPVWNKNTNILSSQWCVLSIHTPCFRLGVFKMANGMIPVSLAVFPT